MCLCRKNDAMETKLVKVKIDIFERQSADDLQRRVRAAHTSGACHLIQYIDRLEFGEGDPAAPRVETSLAGRVFSAAREVRWAQAGPLYTVWTIEEANNGKSYRSRTTRFYLFGKYNDGRFEERHLSPEAFHSYRWSNERKWQDAWRQNDRLYFDVVEYLPVAPSAEVDIGEVERALNGSRVAAHRVVGIGKGQETERTNA